MAQVESASGGSTPVTPTAAARSATPGDPNATLWRWVVPGVLLLAGLLFATTASLGRHQNLRASDTTDLVALVSDMDAKVESRNREVAVLQTQIDGLAGSTAPGNDEVAALTTKADALAPAAGRFAVTGPAVTVTLDDAHRTAASLPQGFTADDIVVHQQDVQSVVNALWAGGAEAMMLMDQRVVSTSAVRCVGNTLILQGRVYSPPFVIRAIGDVSAMKRSLDADRSVTIYRQYVDALGLGYAVDTVAKATFPAYAGSVAPQWARVIR